MRQGTAKSQRGLRNVEGGELPTKPMTSLSFFRGYLTVLLADIERSAALLPLSNYPSCVQRHCIDREKEEHGDSKICSVGHELLVVATWVRDLRLGFLVVEDSRENVCESYRM